MIRRVSKNEISVIVNMKIMMLHEAGKDKLLPDNAFDIILSHYNKIFDEDRMAHYCVEKNDRIVACAGGFLKSDIPFCFFEPNYYGFIGDVYTDINYRQKGYATQLTKEVIKWLKEKSVKIIKLLTSEAGKKIYMNLGFEESDEMILKIK